MSLLTDLLAKAQKVAAGVEAEGVTVADEVKADVKDLVENLQHEVEKETSNGQKAEGEADAAPGAGVQTSGDVNGPTA